MNGLSNGFNDALNNGFNDALNNGLNDALNNGLNDGLNDAWNNGWNGFNSGFTRSGGVPIVVEQLLNVLSGFSEKISLVSPQNLTLGLQDLYKVYFKFLFFLVLSTKNY